MLILSYHIRVDPENALLQKVFAKKIVGCIRTSPLIRTHYVAKLPHSPC
jgi:hypothetical protein